MWVSESDWRFFIASLVAFGVVVGGLLAIGIPWLWGIIKPWLHTITA